MRRVFTIIILLNVTFLFSQQTSQFAHYFHKPYLINPAFVGDQPYMELFTVYHKRWIGLPGSPETALLALDGSIREKKQLKQPYNQMGLGLTISNDVTNIIGKTSGLLSYRYRIKLNDDFFVALGMSAGILQYRIDFSKIEADDAFEETLLESAENATEFDGAVGVSFDYKNLKIGFASQQIFQNKLGFGSQPDQREVSFQLIRHFNLFTSYDYFYKRWKFQPSILLLSAQGLPTQLQATLKTTFQDFVWAGVSYNSNSSIGGLAGINVNNSIDIGYAYEYPLSSIRNLTGGSHEIFVSLKLNKITRSEKIRKNFEAEIQEKSDSTIQQQSEKIDVLEQKNERTKTQLEKEQQLRKNQEQELAELKDQLEEEKKKTADLVERLKAESAKKYDEGHKGGGYYLIVGVLANLDVAKRYQKYMKIKAGINTTIIESKSEEQASSNYLVSAGKYSTWAKAYQALIRLKNDSQLKTIKQASPWIYLK